MVTIGPKKKSTGSSSTLSKLKVCYLLLFLAISSMAYMNNASLELLLKNKKEESQRSSRDIHLEVEQLLKERAKTKLLMEGLQFEKKKNLQLEDKTKVLIEGLEFEKKKNLRLEQKLREGSDSQPDIKSGAPAAGTGSMSPALISMPILKDKKKPQRKIVLVGPHDRYNFGDLLFEKVLSKLLLTRAGYFNEDIVRSGITDVNMTKYGGHDQILNLKRTIELSQNDAEKGPYDIVYTGGESAGSSHKTAVSVLPNKLKSAALRNQVSNCGYLIPKTQLRPIDENGTTIGNVQNYAIANSIGGSAHAHPYCKGAIDTADFAVFRDTEPLAPDSAIMVKELFGDHIADTYKQVKKEIFPTHEEAKSNNNDDVKYIAVQQSMGHLRSEDAIKEVARVLDNVSMAAGNKTIVLFAAGTVPFHDSISLYHKIQATMTQPAIVYEAEHVWKVVALISKAQAVISTSLHVRIMAFIFFRPRVTWCRDDKYEKHGFFIKLWDASDSPPCFLNKTETWSVLEKYMIREGAHGPEITQEETRKKYHDAVKMYLTSFDKWTNMLM